LFRQKFNNDHEQEIKKQISHLVEIKIAEFSFPSSVAVSNANRTKHLKKIDVSLII
jgi:hypothetical protein